MYDIEKIRADFPALNQLHHDDVPLVYLDNAATSQKPRQVIDALSDYYSRYNSNVHRGIHKLSEQATEAYEIARDKVQHFINAKTRREIIYTRGTTESINLVAQTWGRANLDVGDVVLTSVMEHHSNIVSWQILAQEKGFTIKYVTVTDDGLLDFEQYKQLLHDENVKLVAMIHSSNTLGTINPIAEMTQLAHESGALILVDAAQSVPHMPIDVQALDVDFLAFSGHKMCAPTGIGVLYGKEALLEAMPPWMGGGDMIERVTLEGSTWNELPYKFEAGTPIIAGVIGLGYAVDYLSSIGMTDIFAHEQEIAEYASDRLVEVPGVTLLGPDSQNRGGVTAFTFEGIHAHDMAQILDGEGIAVRSGHHCTMPLHDHLGISASARASFYLYNTKAEVDALIEGIYKAKQLFG